MARGWICARTFCCPSESCGQKQTAAGSGAIAHDRFDVPYDCSVELSPLGNQFLTDIFEAYDKVSIFGGLCTWS